MFHPEGLFLAGAQASYPSSTANLSVVIENIFTGDVEAELYLFKNSPDWLIRTKSGHVNGSHNGLAHVTKRKVNSLSVSVDPGFVKSVTNVAEVRATLSQKLPEGESLAESLSKLPQPNLPEPTLPTPQREVWYDWSYDRRLKIARKIEQAGGSVRTNLHKLITFVHLEGQQVSEELLKELRWAGRIERLYLAETGLTDQQLDHVGLLSYVKRMSLWGNPITDDGLLELSTMYHLEVLDIHDTQVTAHGINQLKVLPNLKRLIVPKSVRVDQLTPLKTRLPELKILSR